MYVFFDLDGMLTDPKEKATYMARLVPDKPVHFHHCTCDLQGSREVEQRRSSCRETRIGRYRALSH